MTKREFDSVTKVNHGCRMASDERAAYRQERRIDDSRPSLLDRRFAAMAWRNFRYPSGDYADLCGFLFTLGAGSKWRNVAAYRRDSGLELLA